MKTFIVLIKFTAQGIRAIKESPSRGGKFIENIEASGISVKGQYWTFGAYDGALVLESPDEDLVHAAILSLAKAGNVETETLRAYDREGFAALVSGVS